MDVRRHAAGIIECTNANESNSITDAAKQDQIVAPDGNLTFWAASDSLALATRAGHHDFCDIALEKFYAVCFDQSVYSKCRPVLALAPGAMTAVNNQRLRLHSIANIATGAAAIMKICAV
jgi:hypothetical protein